MNIPAHVVADLLFQMVPVPTPVGKIIGVSMGQGKMIFKYDNGTTQEVQDNDMIEIIA